MPSFNQAASSPTREALAFTAPAALSEGTNLPDPVPHWPQYATAYIDTTPPVTVPVSGQIWPVVV